MYKIYQKVLVNRRVDPNNDPLTGKREWVEGIIMDGPRTGPPGSNLPPGWKIGFADGYKHKNGRPWLWYGEGMLKPLTDMPASPRPVECAAPKAKKILHENCPKCGSAGRWIRAALVCETHGAWAGC